MSDRDIIEMATYLSTAGASIFGPTSTTYNTAPNEFESTYGGTTEGPLQAAAVFTTIGPTSSVGSTSSEEPGAVLIIFKNDLPYDTVEKRAKEVYDLYDKNHDKAPDAGASLVMTSNQAKELYDTLVGDKSPEVLIEELEVAKKVYKKSI